jgi:predicted PurR-regulated permease PerM
VVFQTVSATFNTWYYFLYVFHSLFYAGEWQKNGKNIYEHIPLKDENAMMLGTEVKNMVMSNSLLFLLLPCLQGVVALIGYLIIGVKEPWFWFVVTCITAMLP